MYSPGVVGSVVASFLIGLFVLLVWASISARKECEASGGVWKNTGSHVVMVYNAATKSTIPSTVPTYECIQLDTPTPTPKQESVTWDKW